MAIRKGMFQQPDQPAAPPGGGAGRDVKPHHVIGRSITPKAAPPPEPSRIIQDTRMDRRPSLREQPIRGMLTDATGKPLRGLSQTTIAAHQAHTEAATEQCTRCGEMRPPAQMRTLIANAENPNNPLRACLTECVPVTYKSPYQDKDKWQPQVPSVRFDRDRGSPYNARERGVTLGDLVTKDTYHKESEVEAHQRPDVLVGEGRWSGGGKAGHGVSQQSLEQSRIRAERARR